MASLCAHKGITRLDLMTTLEKYVAEKNAERKTEAYKHWLQYKEFKASDKKKNKWAALLDTSDTDAQFLPTRGKRVKFGRFWHRYNKISVSTIFARASRNPENDDDLDSNDMAAVRDMIMRKLLPLVAFSITLATLFFDNGTFSLGVLINTFCKLFRNAMSIYTSAAAGQDFVRETLLTKMERRLDFVHSFTASTAYIVYCPQYFK